MELFTYFRSSAAYRVRIALNLKQLEADLHPVHLVRNEQQSLRYRQLNPLGRVPTFVDNGIPITQSLAIIEYLEEIHPNPPLLPTDEADRAWIRSLALTVACDIHPLNNLGVLRYLENELGLDEAARVHWIRHWIGQGFNALEEVLSRDPRVKRFCYGDRVTMADVFLVPQVFNAERFGVDMALYPTIARINAACMALDAFIKAAPANQPDAE